jgi:beta-lactam-binding protein with PASTA domain
MDAKRILENEGLEVGRVTYKPDFSKDVVLEYYVNGQKMDSSNIHKGYLVSIGTKVDLLVADGRGEEEFDVPNLIGLSEEEAEEVAKAHEISLHKTYDYKSSQASGTVIWQNPATYIGATHKGTKQPNKRERNKIRSGDAMDIRIVGN